MWLGPAPKVPFNKNRWGVGVTTFPTFRYFWDYAGGAMTDWGVHLIDPVHQCFGEPMPLSVSAQGDKFYVQDNVDTPDTMMATFRYPKFLLTYESRTVNPMPMFAGRRAVEQGGRFRLDGAAGDFDPAFGAGELCGVTAGGEGHGQAAREAAADVPVHDGIEEALLGNEAGAFVFDGDFGVGESEVEHVEGVGAPAAEEADAVVVDLIS